MKLRGEDVIRPRRRTEQESGFRSGEQAGVEDDAGREDEHAAEREEEQIEERGDDRALKRNLVRGQLIEQIPADGKGERGHDRARENHREEANTARVERDAEGVLRQPKSQLPEDAGLLGGGHVLPRFAKSSRCNFDSGEGSPFHEKIGMHSAAND